MTSAASRLLREVRDISSQQIPAVFGEPEESDILHWRGMILGPPHTPYALGMFHFDLKFPQDYPNSPPKVLITTTSGGQVRFNPNLYATGKVCLSILGTWRAEHSGEQWSAVQSSQSILLSIQSLMNDAPYHTRVCACGRVRSHGGHRREPCGLVKRCETPPSAVPQPTAPRSPAAALVPSPARPHTARRPAHAPNSQPVSLGASIAGRRIICVFQHPTPALLHVLPGASSPRPSFFTPPSAEPALVCRPLAGLGSSALPPFLLAPSHLARIVSRAC